MYRKIGIVVALVGAAAMAYWVFGHGTSPQSDEKRAEAPAKVADLPAEESDRAAPVARVRDVPVDAAPVASRDPANAPIARPSPAGTEVSPPPVVTLNGQVAEAGVDAGARPADLHRGTGGKWTGE